MRALFGVLRKRWFLSLLGLLALSLAIWVIGPLFAFADYRPLEPEWRRWILIAALFAIWIGRMLWRWLQGLRANNNLFAGLTATAPRAPPSATEQATADELAELGKRMQEALGLLKKTRVKGSFGTRYLYQLPWYVILGAPGAGKTTALLNSGLRFPLAERLGPDAIRGVGGTRNCDWWFTDEAVLLDTAGRYTTQTSDREVDKAAWTGFLDLLKRHRGRRPINGALVAISVADLLRQSPGERDRHARDIRQRLQELREGLGIRFPVYVLFTKCDLLAGFVEFFGDLTAEQRAQVWGSTFALADQPDPDANLTQFGPEFDALEKRLNSRLLLRVQQERDPQRRALIYSFPQEFGATKAAIIEFLRTVFQTSRFEERSLLRGIYFTSGTQEGTPLDRVMTSLARAYGLQQSPLSANVATGRSYFITRLLKDVAFPEAELAGTNLRQERRLAWLKRGAYAGLGALAAVVILAWIVSYGRNQHSISEVGRQADAIRGQLQNFRWDQASLDAVLPVLDALRSVPGGYSQRDETPPLTMRFGLYQGYKLGSEAQAAYRRCLDKILLPRVAARLEQHLRIRSRDFEDAFETLKVYLMLNDPGRFDVATVQGWTHRDWVERLSEIPPEKRPSLKDHTDALFDTGQLTQSVGLDQQLVDDVRRQLLSGSPARRIYERIKQHPEAAKLQPFSVTGAAGDDARFVLVRRSGQPLGTGIPGLFTNAGYHDYYRQSLEIAVAADLKETWVLGVSPTAQVQSLQVLEEINRLYFDEYISQWETFLGDIVIAPMPNLERAEQVLGYLARPDSPLRRFLEAAARDTTLATKQGAPQKVAGIEVPRIIGKTWRKTPFGQVGETPVDRRFAGLHRLAKPDDAGKAPMDNSLALLKEVHGIIVAQKVIKEQGLPPPPNPADEAVLSRVEADGTQQPQPLGGMLVTVAKGTRAAAREVALGKLNQIWVGDIAAFCRQALRGRYPLSRTSAKEATQEDFGGFFGPGGKVEGFYRENLEKYLGPYTAPKSNANLPISRETMAMLQNAKIIREVFFRGGGQIPALNFELKPVRMDAQINQFILDVDGQIVRYEHGPAVVSRLKWPSPMGASHVRIQISPPAASGTSGLSEDGPWALFKVLDGARIQPTNLPDRFLVTFDIEGRTATFELRASSVYNPFRLQALERFECSEQL